MVLVRIARATVTFPSLDWFMFEVPRGLLPSHDRSFRPVRRGLWGGLFEWFSRISLYRCPHKHHFGFDGQWRLSMERDLDLRKCPRMCEHEGWHCTIGAKRLRLWRVRSTCSLHQIDEICIREKELLLATIKISDSLLRISASFCRRRDNFPAE